MLIGRVFELRKKFLQNFHYQFFSWASATPPQHYPDDWHVNLRASAVATEPWNGENWMSFL